ncbi:MAG: serine/threonine protein kinase [bacterium]|nr:serine/threonine protein kinase [bacterium]
MDDSGSQASTQPGDTPRRRRWTLGLFHRVMLALGAVGLVPVLLASIRLSVVNRDALFEQVLRTHAVVATTAAARIEANIASRRSLVRVSAADVDRAGDLSEPAWGEFLTELLESTTEAGGVAAAILDREGRNVLRAQRQGYGETLETLFALDPGVPVVVGSHGEESWLRLIETLPGDRGSVSLVFDADPLREAIQARELGRQAALVLADQDDRVLLGSVTSLESFPPELIELARSQSVSGSGRYSKDDQEVLGAYAPVDVADTAWFVVSRQPADIAEEVAVRMRRESLVATLTALALTALLSAAAYRTLVRPIRSLIEAQRRLAGAGSGGGDEIAQLKASFRALERHIESREGLDKVFLGRFQVLEMVGEGAMGNVFLGWDPRLRRPVALKTIKLSIRRPDGSAEGEISSDLLTEAITAARFNHPNIIAIYDIEDTPDFSYIAMEFVEGTNLHEYLDRQGRLSVDEAALITVAVANALAEAHSRGVLHNDIKPGNVLLGRKGQVKVTDFGISQAMTTVAEKAGCLFGTPGYVSPEAIRGGRRSESSDLFALGVLAYECLTGKHPFRTVNVMETLMQTLEAEVTAPAESRPDLPLELNQLVLDLLAKNPAERPASAQVVCRRLETIAPSRPASWNLAAPSVAVAVDEEEPTASLSQLIPTVELDRLHGKSRE